MATRKATELLSVYEAAQHKGVTVQTVRKATTAKKNRLPVAKEVKVGPNRTMPMFAVDDLDRWQVQGRDREAGLRKAAELLGLDIETAREMKAKADAQRASQRARS